MYEDPNIKILNEKINDYKQNFFPEYDLIIFYGQIGYEVISPWKKKLMYLVDKNNNPDRKLLIFLNTFGGSAEIVEKLVDMTRRFYKEVAFIIPNCALSAGTIWAMSGNKIYMSYASSLGPIDPQVLSKEDKWVPALGYLDKVQEIISKSLRGEISQLEVMMINQHNLAELRSYEQAKELSIALLKKWLTKYKFEQWDYSETLNTKVTKEMKEQRAREIAEKLSDNNIWCSHGRFISIETLQNDLKLKIDDFTEQKELLLATDELDELFINYTLNKYGPATIFTSTI